MKYSAKDKLLMALAAVIWIALCVWFWVIVDATEKARVEKIPIEETEIVPEVVPEVVPEEPIDEYEADVPLTYQEQRELRSAAEEFGIDYSLMLGLIEKETEFRNIPGDGGEAYGYCQVWLRWWKGKMQDIGATDLNIPKDNFRTACAIMRELTDRYGSYAGALTAYNKGSFDGVVSNYATTVLQNAERWKKA